MTSIAVQTTIGNIGSKAATELSLGFKSMINTGEFQFGFNSNGIFLLNQGEQDDGVPYTRSFTLASSDFGVSNLKRFRYLYIEAFADKSITVSVMGDKKVWKDYTEDLRKTGIQRIRVPIGRNECGMNWTIELISDAMFRVSKIEGLLIVRPSGARG